MQTMNDLSLHFLQDIYDAEKRAVRSMQRMARAASNEQLKQAITHHRDQSQAQITRLEQVFELTTGKRPRGKTCAAMAGLVKEVEEAIADAKSGPVLDAALIACAQAIEHYEIARYGAMAAWALQAGKDDVARLLHETLEEEKSADLSLSQLAESVINPEVPEVGAQTAPAPRPRAAASPKAAKANTAKPAPAKSNAATAKPAAVKRGRKPAEAIIQAPPPPMKRRGRPPAAR